MEDMIGKMRMEMMKKISGTAIGTARGLKEEEAVEVEEDSEVRVEEDSEERVEEEDEVEDITAFLRIEMTHREITEEDGETIEEEDTGIVEGIERIEEDIEVVDLIEEGIKVRAEEVTDFDRTMTTLDNEEAMMDK